MFTPAEHTLFCPEISDSPTAFLPVLAQYIFTTGTGMYFLPVSFPARSVSHTALASHCEIHLQ